jgi:ABC-type transport system involved in cytochrome bd biosynthesis fused ATPase/permease subunit
MFTQVIVIDKGTIAESGTHDELLNKDGVYKKLVLRQLTAGGQNDSSLDTANNGITKYMYN